jgi:pheromone receptor transcription factor
MQDDSAKRADPTAHAPAADQFINDQDANDSAGDDDEDEEKPKSDKKTGRRKIKIEFIQDKSRRHITFSKRKAGPSFFTRFLVEPHPLIHIRHVQAL